MAAVAVLDRLTQLARSTASVRVWENFEIAVVPWLLHRFPLQSDGVLLRRMRHLLHQKYRRMMRRHGAEILTASVGALLPCSSLTVKVHSAACITFCHLKGSV